MSYVSLYRAWRPQMFNQVVGQQVVVKLLTQSIIRNKIAHAYLFSGPRGTGKTSLARIYAKALNCLQSEIPEPCNKCENCRAIDAGSFLDVIEIDAASNRGIDDARALRDNLAYMPVAGKYKIYIIDEAHMLTTEAFNALLKMLEEPPANVVFILATTALNKIPVTVQSRCQRIDFQNIELDQIANHIMRIANERGAVINGAACNLVAERAEGGMRNALSILEQCLLLSGDEPIDETLVRELLGLPLKQVVEDLWQALSLADLTQAFVAYRTGLEQGAEPAAIIGDLAKYLRQQIMDQLPTNNNESYVDEMLSILDLLCRAEYDIAHGFDSQMTTEFALIKICRRTFDASFLSLDNRLKRLESKLKLESMIPLSEVKNQLLGEEDSPVTDTSLFDLSEALLPKPFSDCDYADSSGDDIVSEQNNEHFQKIWRDVIQRLLDGNKRALVACVDKAKILDIKNNVVKLGFDLQLMGAFCKSRAERSDYSGAISEALSAVLNQDSTVEMVEIHSKKSDDIDKDVSLKKINNLFSSSQVNIIK